MCILGKASDQMNERLKKKELIIIANISRKNVDLSISKCLANGCLVQFSLMREWKMRPKQFDFSKSLHHIRHRRCETFDFPGRQPVYSGGSNIKQRFQDAIEHSNGTFSAKKRTTQPNQQRFSLVK